LTNELVFRLNNFFLKFSYILMYIMNIVSKNEYYIKKTYVSLMFYGDKCVVSNSSIL